MRSNVKNQTRDRSSFRGMAALTVRLFIVTVLPWWVNSLKAQIRAEASGETPSSLTDTHTDLSRRVETLEAEVAELKRLLKDAAPAGNQLHGNAASESDIAPARANANPVSAGSSALAQDDRKTLDFFRDTTINLGLDGYYAFNFNQPVGRVNLLRAYDVLSNNISLNQASVIFEHAPDVDAGRRFGTRLDLQFGQATDTCRAIRPTNHGRKFTEISFRCTAPTLCPWKGLDD